MKLALSFCLVICISACAIGILRDPFIRDDGQHAYVYTAFGTIHNLKCHFGLLSIDGLFYQVKSGDRIAGHVILEVTESEITLKNPQGQEKKILLQKKALQLR